MVFSVASTLTPSQTPVFAQKPAEFEPDNGKSVFGTPILSFIEFPEGSYQTLEGEVINYDGIKIAEVLLVVTQTKNIVTTQINGRNGTVKEYVSDGDYVINVVGMAVNDKNAFPEKALNALKEICKVPDTLIINCPFLQYFGITAGVVTDYSFSEKQGVRNVIDFTINIISDTPPVESNFTTQEGRINPNNVIGEF